MRILRLGMSGTDVMEIQAMLQKIGYYSGPIDGIFGPQTQQAVIRFQRNFGLTPDGVIGPNTYRAMERYLLGSDIYTVRSGDSFYSIARRYGTGLDLLLAANPGLDPDNLRIGQQLVVPYGFNVVDTNISYTYEILQRDIQGPELYEAGQRTQSGVLQCGPPRAGMDQRSIDDEVHRGIFKGLC